MVIFILFNFLKKLLWANRGELDQTPRFTMSDLAFYCSSLSHKKDARLIWRPSQGFLGTGEQGHLFQGNRGTNAIFSGEQRNKQWNLGKWGTYSDIQNGLITDMVSISESMELEKLQNQPTRISKRARKRKFDFDFLFYDWKPVVNLVKRKWFQIFSQIMYLTTQ